MATGATDFTFGFVDTPGFREFAEVPNYSTRRVIYFTSPFVYTQGFYKGAVIRTATGSGVGSGTATKLRSVFRTATGAGTGSSSVAYIEVLPRSATGSGLGSSGGGATGLHIAPRTATGSGLGNSSTVSLYGAVRTATGAGVGSATALFRRNRFRTATGSGTGTETGSGVQIVRVSATGSGTGTQSATFYKVLLFRPPTENVVAYFEYGQNGLASQLFKFYSPEPRGKNVYKLTDGTYTENEQNDPSVVSITYHGGHVIPVTQEEKDDLVAAGYGAYVS